MTRILLLGMLLSVAIEASQLGLHSPPNRNKSPRRGFVRPRRVRHESADNPFIGLRNGSVSTLDEVSQPKEEDSRYLLLENEQLRKAWTQKVVSNLRSPTLYLTYPGRV